MTWEEIRRLQPWLPESSDGWHQHERGGGWVRDGVYVAPRVRVMECAVFHGGVFHDGEFHGGVFYGGEFYDGEFHGGVFHGGVFHGGEFHTTPLLIYGSRYWIGWSGKDLVSSGCITKPLEWWLENVERCAEENGYSTEEQAEYREHIEHIARWMRRYGVAATN